jgi:acetyl esterase/lipase
MRAGMLAVVVSVALLGTEAAAMPLMSWPDLLSRPRPHASERIAYGTEPSQFADLWLPVGEGPHPVVVLIHGGCWTKSIADLSIMDWAADDLRKRGFAVWNIEYRRLGEPGGGYPGTYQDVAAALDRLPAEARARGLGAGPYVVVGHSAGGHLALWAAARRNLPKTSPLLVAHPLPVKSVVDIAGIPNLETDTETACGADKVAKMAGPPSADRPDVFADTSPAHLVPLGVPVTIIHGADDVTVAPAIGAAFAARARAAGDRGTVLTPPGGHVEEIAPGTEAWAVVLDAIERAVRSK